MIDKLKIIRDLKSHLQLYYGNYVKDVILFGSQAVGKAKVDSDFDVLIVLEKPYSKEDESKLLDLCYEIDLKHNILLDVHIISQTEINSLRGKQPIYTNALTKGVYA